MKKLPAFLRTIVFYTWLASLGLHGLALVIPIPSSDSSSEQQPEQPPVKVVKLPKPSPSDVRRSPPPKAVSTPVAKKPPLPRKPAAAIPAPIQTPVGASSKASPPTRPPESKPTPTPTVTPSPAVTPSPNQPDAFAEFPNRTDAKPGCNGLTGCWQVEESQWRSVAGDLRQRLEKQGYQVDPVDHADDTGMQVYKVSKDGVQNYLHLISRDQRTVYLLQPELLSRDELERAANLGVS